MIDFDPFFNRYRQDLVRYAASFVQNEAAVNDIAIEALYKCWERQSIFKTDEDAFIYAKVLVRHHCFNYIKHIQSRIQLFGAIDDSQIRPREANMDSLSPEITSIVNKALSNLPEKTMQIFVMSKIDKISQQEISEVMGLSVKSIEYHINKARQALKEALKEFV